MNKTTLLAAAVAATALGMLVANGASAANLDPAVIEYNYNRTAQCEFSTSPILAEITNLQQASLTAPDAVLEVLTDYVGAYELQVDAGSWTVLPASMTPASPLGRSVTVTGANSAPFVFHNDGDAFVVDLSAVGSSTLNIGLSKSPFGDVFTSEVVPGDYTYSYTVRCVAKL